jgi:hypothetical protein
MTSVALQGCAAWLLNRLQQLCTHCTYALSVATCKTCLYLASHHDCCPDHPEHGQYGQFRNLHSDANIALFYRLASTPQVGSSRLHINHSASATMQDVKDSASSLAHSGARFVRSSSGKASSSTAVSPREGLRLSSVKAASESSVDTLTVAALLLHAVLTPRSRTWCVLSVLY